VTAAAGVTTGAIDFDVHSPPASDYPHDHGDGPGMLLDGLDEDARAAVLSGNAGSRDS
jgi:hypothetical protein